MPFPARRSCQRHCDCGAARYGRLLLHRHRSAGRPQAERHPDAVPFYIDARRTAGAARKPLASTDGFRGIPAAMPNRGGTVTAVSIARPSGRGGERQTRLLFGCLDENAVSDTGRIGLRCHIGRSIHRPRLANRRRARPQSTGFAGCQPEFRRDETAWPASGRHSRTTSPARLLPGGASQHSRRSSDTTKVRLRIRRKRGFPGFQVFTSQRRHSC